MPVGYVSSPTGPDRSRSSPRTPASPRRTVCPHCQRPIASPLPSPTALSPSTALRAATSSSPASDPHARSASPAPAHAHAHAAPLLAPLPIGDEPLVTFGELERWSALAGVPMPAAPPSPRPSSPSPSARALQQADAGPGGPSGGGAGNAFPLLPPPPASGQPVKRGPAGGRGGFGFFRRASQRAEHGDDDSDDDEAGATGYARIGVGSDGDSEGEGEGSVRSTPRKGGREDKAEAGDRTEGGDEAEGEEGFAEAWPDHEAIDEAAPSALPRTEEAATDKAVAEPASLDPSDLQQCLREVLARVNMLSSSHAALLSTHSTLVTDLKIARSNLAMAEANTEMLEEQLRRSTRAQLGGASPGTQPSSGAADTPRAALVASPASRPASPALATPAAAGAGGAGPHRASSLDHRRPASLQLPTSEPKAAGMFGFFGAKKRATAHGTPTLPDGDAAVSPAAATAAAAAPAAVQALRARAPSLARSASQGAVPTAPFADGPAARVAALEAQVAAMLADRAAAAAELDALKRGKKEIEAELEGLSQALFEEANGMVADERRRAAELEEALREAREEGKVLRETVKVLGGSGPAVSAGPEGEGEWAEEEAPQAGDAALASAQADWKPRDLDRHYEALRKSIQHVAVDAPASSSRSVGGGRREAGDAGEDEADDVGVDEADEADTEDAAGGTGLAAGASDAVDAAEVDKAQEMDAAPAPEAEARATRVSVDSLGPDPWAT